MANKKKSILTLTEQFELLGPFLKHLGETKQACGYNPIDNYYYRIVQGAALAWLIDPTIHIGPSRPTKKKPYDFGNSRTEKGESKSCYIDTGDADGSFEFTNQNMPTEQAKLHNHESFLFSVNNEREEILFIMYLNDQTTTDALKSIIIPKQQIMQKKHGEERCSNMRPSISVKISEVLNINGVRFVNHELKEVTKEDILKYLGQTPPTSNPFFG
jgi:hypothetical protein